MSQVLGSLRAILDDHLGAKRHISDLHGPEIV